jgi:hypothetical protein
MVAAYAVIRFSSKRIQTLPNAIQSNPNSIQSIPNAIQTLPNIFQSHLVFDTDIAVNTFERST